jgi:hypothetical protein
MALMCSIFKFFTFRSPFFIPKNNKIYTMVEKSLFINPLNLLNNIENERLLIWN